MKRDCCCPRARHVHGTAYAYQRDKCRCVDCRSAWAAHMRALRFRKSRQRWNGGTDWTDPTGTVRRLQALAAEGWTLADLADLLGVTRSGVHMLRSDPPARMLTATAERVRAVYEQLGPPDLTPARRVARARALRRGWAPPLAWDDDDLDNPAATPHVDDIRHGTRSGYVTHRARGEDACGACLEAERVYQAARYRNRKAAA